MSDIINPEPNDGKVPVADVESVAAGAPHSGKLAPEEGGELPVVEHDAPLSEAILSVPEHPGTLTESVPQDKKRWRKPLAAVAILGVAAGSLLAATRSDDSENTKSEVPEVTTTAPEILNDNNTGLSNSEKLNLYNTAKAEYLNYEDFEVEPVYSNKPDVYVSEFNKLIAVVVMESEQQKAEQALAILTGATETPSKFRDGLLAERDKNLNFRDKEEGGRDTYISDPNNITVIRSGDNYEIVKTTNVAIQVRNDKLQEPQEYESTKQTAYYYIRIMPDGRRHLFAVDNVLSNWVGGVSFDS